MPKQIRKLEGLWHNTVSFTYSLGAQPYVFLAALAYYGSFSLFEYVMHLCHKFHSTQRIYSNSLKVHKRTHNIYILWWHKTNRFG